MTGTLFSILKEAGSHNRDTITNDRDTIKSYRKTISNPEFSSPRTNFELSKNSFIRMAKAIFGALVQNSDTVPLRSVIVALICQYLKLDTKFHNWAQNVLKWAIKGFRFLAILKFF